MQAQMQAHAMAAAMAAFGRGRTPARQRPNRAGRRRNCGRGFDRAPPSNAEDADASEGVGRRRKSHY